MNLDTPIAFVRGVGPKLSENFAKAGISTVRDLIYVFPKNHEDYSAPLAIENIKPGKNIIKARAENIQSRRSRKGASITTATLFDDTGKIFATWFNQPYRAKQLSLNCDFYFIGDYDFSFNRFQLLNPKVELVQEEHENNESFISSYSQIQYIKTSTIRKILSNLRPFMKDLEESIPEAIIKRNNLISFSKAIESIHFPESEEQLEEAKKRLSFDEIFQLILASQLNKKENSKLTGYEINFNLNLVKNFIDSLPFKLTDQQKIAAWDVLRDLQSNSPMNRMIQGDVGSGKTVVAAVGILQTVKAGYQCVLLAPTEILANQHAETLSKLYANQNVNIGLLTSKVKSNNRKLLYKSIEDGIVNVIVGTHAVIQDKLKYHNVGLVVIDEQHRFGVSQRQTLVSKSRSMPHVLTMTATPIPRSLALTLYGELDISILSEKPIGRLPIETHLWSEGNRKQLYEKIDKSIDEGRQVYIICSLIDDNPENDLKSVQTEYKKIRESIFKHRRVGILHGKQKSEDKNSVMNDFKNGLYDILVSTTVVEVGVDVPNATIILIEDSERFGLSQLHQLRGRVGRSSHQSYCYLMTQDNKKASKRLLEIEKSNDGFYLAEVDLKIRGPGEIYGKMQHGALNLQIASLADTKLIKTCLKEAKYFIEKEYQLIKYKELSKQVNYYQILTTLN